MRHKILRLYFGMKAGLWRGGDDVMATDAVFIVPICRLYRVHMLSLSCPYDVSHGRLVIRS